MKSIFFSSGVLVMAIFTVWFFSNKFEETGRFKLIREYKSQTEKCNKIGGFAVFDGEEQALKCGKIDIQMSIPSCGTAI